MCRLPRFGAGLSIVLLLALSPASVRQAAAQAALTVPEIQSCMCEEQKIELMRGQRQKTQDFYDDRQAQVKRLTAQINQMSATMDPNDSMAQDQLSELIDLRTRVQQGIRQKALPDLQQSTNVLNAEVIKYNGQCANRTIYDVDEAAAKKDLICPRP
jgi:hypothetical protein